MINYKFWQDIRKKIERKESIFVLAPMADVTDAAFRIMFAKYGKPDVIWTEFVSADGLASAGAEKLKIDLLFTEEERPIVAQLFTSTPENMYKAVTLCKELGFDGVDINMGCPDRSIEKQGAGAAHIKNVEKSIAVIKAARDAAGEMPVSVKTRIGYNSVEIETWLRSLLELKLPALTVHLRTRKEMSLVPAHWEFMKGIVDLKNEISPETVLIGNGDVKNREEGNQRILETGCDGVMIGRGVFGNPYIFNKEISFSDFDIKKRLDVMVEHTELFDEILVKHKNFSIMKKHYKAYVNGFDGAKELRMELMEANNSKEVGSIVNKFIKSL